MGSNNLNMGMKCIKYFLIVINALFLLTSLLLITVGRTIQSIYSDFSHFLDDHFMSVPALLVGVGAVMMVVALFGVVGAFKESTMLTNIYGLLLALVFIVEVVAAVYAIVMQGEVYKMLSRTMNESIWAYPEYDEAATAVDFMQRNLQCCGVTNISDWNDVLPIPDDANENDIFVPSSCCPDNPTTCRDNYFREGCLHRMEFIISQSAMIIATGATTVAFVQILGVISAFMLAKTIRRTKSLREARRWQLQQSLGIVSGSLSQKPSYEDYKQLEKTGISNEPVTYSYGEK